MNITKTYNEKELTIEVADRVDTVTAPDFENEINDEMGKFDSLILDSFHYILFFFNDLPQLIF